MDFGQHRALHLCKASSSPGYPTPPPSFTHCSPQGSECAAYDSPYEYSSLNSDLVDDFTQVTTQTPTHTPSQSFLYSSPLQDPPTSSSTIFGANNHSSLSLEDQNDVVSISTAFRPGIFPTPDTILCSSDCVLFYVHSLTLMNACPGVFQPYIKAPLSDVKFRHKMIALDAPSTELNVILHTLYGNSPAAHSPGFETLVAAVDRMPSYSISPKAVIRPSTALYDLLLSCAPFRPLEVYALGAHHDIHPLALSVSSHLLSYDLSNITDMMAGRMGSVYLKKLLLLHMGRSTALKDILLHPPQLHPPTKGCKFEDQRALTRAWALVSAYLVWEARPDLSTHTMQTALQPLMENLTCKLCHQALKNRIRDVVVNWLSVQRTI